jgi:hypothetical protein
LRPPASRSAHPPTKTQNQIIETSSFTRCSAAMRAR